jgi:hypothetical protein
MRRGRPRCSLMLTRTSWYCATVKELESEGAAGVLHTHIEDAHHLLECLGGKPRQAVRATWMWCRAVNEARVDSKDDKYEEMTCHHCGQKASGSAAERSRLSARSCW